jgi:hypothetical protein
VSATNGFAIASSSATLAPPEKDFICRVLVTPAFEHVQNAELLGSIAAVRQVPATASMPYR